MQGWSCEVGAALAQVEGSFLGMSEAIDRQPWQPRIITRGSTNNLQYNGPIMANTTNQVIQDPVEITQEFMEYPSLRIVPKGNESSNHHRFSGPMFGCSIFFVVHVSKRLIFREISSHIGRHGTLFWGAVFLGKKTNKKNQVGSQGLASWKLGQINQPTTPNVPEIPEIRALLS